MSRKLAIFQVAPETIMALCQPGKRVFEVIANALPEDAKVYAVGDRIWRFDLDRGTIAILLTSETFAEVPLGAVIPVLDNPVIRVIQRTAFNGRLVCLECGAGLDDQRKELDGVKVGSLFCTNTECGAIIPARAWRET